MDGGVETLDGLGVIRYGNPDRHQDFRPYVVRKSKDGLDHLLCPTRDFAYTDPECGSGNSNVAGRGAGVEPCDDLNSSGPHDFRSLLEVAADSDDCGCVVHETWTRMPHRPYQPRVGDDDKMPDTRAGYLSSAGRVDKSVEDIGARRLGGEDAVHPAKTHSFEHGFCRAGTRIGYAIGHRAPCYSHRTSTYDLRGTVSSAEIVTLLYGAVNVVQPVTEVAWATGSDVFDDVPEGHEADIAIGWAFNGGVTSGVGENRFDPDGTVTRAQIIALVEHKGHGRPESAVLLRQRPTLFPYPPLCASSAFSLIVRWGAVPFLSDV